MWAASLQGHEQIFQLFALGCWHIKAVYSTSRLLTALRTVFSAHRVLKTSTTSPLHQPTFAMDAFYNINLAAPEEIEVPTDFEGSSSSGSGTQNACTIA